MNLEKLLKDFEVTTEEELSNKLLIDDCKTLPCQDCGKEVSINNIIFIDGDPYCTLCFDGWCD